MNDREECGGCIYWDGDDGRCRNESSQHFMHESNDGCDNKCEQGEGNG